MSNRTRNVHVWKTRTEDGGKREVRAVLFGGRWTLSSRPVVSRTEEEPEWTTHDPPALEDLEDLHGVLFAKYQRKHLSSDHLALLERMIEQRRARRR